MGEQAGLVEHGRGRGDEVVDGRRVAVRGEPLGGRGVAVLGRLAEREERLVAAELRRRARAIASTSSSVEVRASRGGPAAWRTCSSRTGRGTAS